MQQIFIEGFLLRRGVSRRGDGKGVAGETIGEPADSGSHKVREDTIRAGKGARSDLLCVGRGEN